MKVLQINDYVTRGGCEVVVQRTVELLSRAGHEVELFASDRSPGHKRTFAGYVGFSPWRRELADCLASFQPDVVHLHNFYHELSPGILATLARHRRDHELRIVMTAHDYHLICPNAGLFYIGRGDLLTADVDRLKQLHYLLVRRWDARSPLHSWAKKIQHCLNYRLGRDLRQVIDLVLCPSRFMEGALSRHALPTVQVPLPAPNAPVRDRERSAGPLRLIFAGRIDPEKGLAEFLGTLPASFEGMMTVVGDGAERDRCQRIVAQRGLKSCVEFVGGQAHEKTLAMIGAAHVLVLPSLWVENSPMSLVEAISLGTNVLVSDIGAMPEIIEDSGVGFRFDPHNEQTLIDVLGEIGAAHESESLNQFDSSSFLAQRSESAYLENLLRVYAGAASG